MSSDSHGIEITDLELESLSKLGADSFGSRGSTATADEGGEPRPPGMDEATAAKWEAAQEEGREKARAERVKRQEEEELRRKQAEDKFKAALDDRINRAFQQGAAGAVSREALRAVSVRSYVLLGVVAAVVAMPLIGMLLHLDPQAFGAYIAPVTGITGTIVGYWFGTVGQGTAGQGTPGQGPIQPSRGRSSSK
jgi:hypothetical protein